MFHTRCCYCFIITLIDWIPGDPHCGPSCPLAAMPLQKGAGWEEPLQGCVQHGAYNTEEMQTLEALISGGAKMKGFLRN